jgi:hypothetical protein
MGGEVWWDNVAEHGGWKLQQNTLTKHARILDDQNVRRYWGTFNGMKRAMDRMASYLEENNSKNI